MSMATLEKAILQELKDVTKNNKLKLKNMMEWSTGGLEAREGETKTFCPEIAVWVCWK